MRTKPSGRPSPHQLLLELGRHVEKFLLPNDDSDNSGASTGTSPRDNTLRCVGAWFLVAHLKRAVSQVQPAPAQLPDDPGCPPEDALAMETSMETSSLMDLNECLGGLDGELPTDLEELSKDLELLKDWEQPNDLELPDSSQSQACY